MSGLPTLPVPQETPGGTTGRCLLRQSETAAHSQGEDAIAMRQKLITGPVVGPAQPKLPGVDPPPPPFTLVIHAWRCRGFAAPTLLRGPRSRNGPGPMTVGICSSLTPS